MHGLKEKLAKHFTSIKTIYISLQKYHIQMEVLVYYKCIYVGI